MFKRFCCMLVILLLVYSTALAEGVTIAPYQSTAEEDAYAALLGLDTPHVLYSFTADAESCFRLSVYSLEEGRWHAADTKLLPFSGSGRLYLDFSQLGERLCVAIQDQRGTRREVYHPLFGISLNGQSTTSATLCEAASLHPGVENVLVLHAVHTSDESPQVELSCFADPTALTCQAFAITLCVE